MADEPTAAVDKNTAEKIRDQFKELTANLGTTLIMVTHDESLVREAADRVLTIELAPPHPHPNVVRSTLREEG